MSTEPKEEPLHTVFLSYASEDRAAAQVLRDALPAFGLEVWYDESALHGGDAWDQKIRNQIRDCDYFMPLISARTEARSEGYFRREWRLAVERSLDMADDHTFILPVVIDDTSQTNARVPEKFFTVQWSRLPGGQPTPVFEAVCRRLASGAAVAPAKRSERGERARRSDKSERREFPPMPKQEPGQKFKFVFAVIYWALQCAWIQFRRLPRWIRILAYVWIFVVLLSKGCTKSDTHAHKFSDADAQKLNQISQEYQGSMDKKDVAKLGAQIAKAFADEADASKRGTPIVAVPFAAPSGDPAAQKFADTTFAQVYGRLSISHHGHAALIDTPLSLTDASAVLAHAREQHADYAVYGFVDGTPPNQTLHVKLLDVDEGTESLSKSYPVTGADPAKIAEDLDAKIKDAE